MVQGAWGFLFSAYWCIFLQLPVYYVNQPYGWLPVKDTTSHFHEKRMARQMEGKIQSLLEEVLTAHWRHWGIWTKGICFFVQVIIILGKHLLMILNHNLAHIITPQLVKDISTSYMNCNTEQKQLTSLTTSWIIYVHILSWMDCPHKTISWFVCHYSCLHYCHLSYQLFMTYIPQKSLVPF